MPIVVQFVSLACYWLICNFGSVSPPHVFSLSFKWYPEVHLQLLQKGATGHCSSLWKIQLPMAVSTLQLVIVSSSKVEMQASALRTAAILNKQLWKRHTWKSGTRPGCRHWAPHPSPQGKGFVMFSFSCSYFLRYLAVPSGFPGNGIPRRRRWIFRPWWLLGSRPGSGKTCLTPHPHPKEQTHSGKPNGALP